MITLNVSYLDWQTQCSFDPHEWDPRDLSHPCMKWCKDNNIKADFFMNAEYLVNEDGFEELVWQEPDVCATFYTEYDAVLFKLMWSEQ